MDPTASDFESTLKKRKTYDEHQSFEGDHVSKRKKEQCYNCGGFGHYRTLCPSPPNSVDGLGQQCFLCGGHGHIRDICPNNLPPEHCFNCGKLGHRAKECSSPSGSYYQTNSLHHYPPSHNIASRGFPYFGKKTLESLESLTNNQKLTR